MKIKNEVVEIENENLKEYRIFGNRFTQEEYNIISNGLKKLKKDNLNNTDILLALLKKKVRNTLKDNIYKLKNKIYILENNEIERVLKLYFLIKYRASILPHSIKKRSGIISFEFINTSNEKYVVVIFDKNKKKFKEKLISCSNKGRIILWDPANICQIKDIEKIDAEDVNFFIDQFKHIIFS
ncbi:hypothetical protein [Fusobacterium sp.]|uniref:hypothetical protein n=1 Tax=Fusobacterium sp. TaxID=68766 RepID=UPI002903A786|nr:hypothetical protein [Fusobacterium sp.]MDU1910380.1 hypothetical protein [Fusobacterium sp.]